MDISPILQNCPWSWEKLVLQMLWSYVSCVVFIPHNQGQVVGLWNAIFSTPRRDEILKSQSFRKVKESHICS
jgi:hypothetical protein